MNLGLLDRQFRVGTGRSETIEAAVRRAWLPDGRQRIHIGRPHSVAL